MVKALGRGAQLPELPLHRGRAHHDQGWHLPIQVRRLCEGSDQRAPPGGGPRPSPGPPQWGARVQAALPEGADTKRCREAEPACHPEEVCHQVPPPHLGGIGGREGRSAAAAPYPGPG